MPSAGSDPEDLVVGYVGDVVGPNGDVGSSPSAACSGVVVSVMGDPMVPRSCSKWPSSSGGWCTGPLGVYWHSVRRSKGEIASKLPLVRARNCPT